MSITMSDNAKDSGSTAPPRRRPACRVAQYKPLPPKEQGQVGYKINSFNNTKLTWAQRIAAQICEDNK